MNDAPVEATSGYLAVDEQARAAIMAAEQDAQTYARVRQEAGLVKSGEWRNYLPEQVEHGEPAAVDPEPYEAGLWYSPIPVGLMAVYRLTERDAAYVNAQRQSEDRHANTASEGDELPFLICKVWGPNGESAVNGQLMVDGDFTMWFTSRMQGKLHEPGRWFVIITDCISPTLR